MKISFKLKLIFSYIFVILVSFGFIAFFLDKNLEENSIRNIESSLITQANLIESQIFPERLRQEDTPYLESLVKASRLKTKCRITIIDSKGRVLADSEKSQEEIPQMENHLYRPEVKVALTGVTGIDTRYSSTLKIDMLYVAVPIKNKTAIPGILRLSLPLESVQKTLFAIRRIVFIGLLFALVFAFILGSIVARRTIKPINRMIQISRKFSEGDFSRRIIHNSKDEIGELANTLNNMAQDIEDKIKEIEAQNQKVAAIFNSMIEGVIVVDKSARVISINPTVEKIFGISKKYVEGKLLLEAIRNNDISESINDAIKNGRSVSGEISLVLPVRKIFQINAVPIFDNDSINGCLAVIHDITEMRRLETMRSDFVANVSHELKTPLTSIKGFVETLLEGALDDKENNRNFLKIIYDHTERLNNLVEDLLSLSHLESKEIILNKKSFNLRQQLEEAISTFKAQLKKNGIEVKNELPISISVTADQDRMEQVFTNLIDNAIKFNKEKGAIRIYIQEVNGKIKVFVEDKGIGIPEKDIPRIFERFYRVDKARSRELGGTGLGLSIVKHIVELHGGNVGVESAEGLGSKFWFTIPK
ncbi:MAG: PAS domain-containing sensor histidine kinase [Candidatus Omnitrophica bacterium CG07_land_8_20_14_0_80_42_15]|uniref:histidine kinase n=1 Tax=Candidatus Aquitaenariimonas noxiae TaxID=1974741 RepID=A0A2J0KUB9_9BACT|nr:MAG: PAS domain-containing sensor histidine kinase [Candidatus Omnitrophica bacterium CG07_land_8_20_14_0_80_42_15]